MAKLTTLDMTKDIMPGFTMTVCMVGMKEWRLRMYIAGGLLRLLALIMKLNI